MDPIDIAQEREHTDTARAIDAARRPKPGPSRTGTACTATLASPMAGAGATLHAATTGSANILANDAHAPRLPESGQQRAARGAGAFSSCLGARGVRAAGLRVLPASA